MKYFRYGHLQSIKVKVGQAVKRGDMIGTLGGTPNWSPHLHFDIFRKKPLKWTAYVIGKSLEYVKEWYEDPRPYADKTIPTEYDYLGYDWLEKATYTGGTAYHSGLDINGKGAGASDLGNPVYSAVDGIVEYLAVGNNEGWGNFIIINNKTMTCETEKKEIEQLKARILERDTTVSDLREKLKGRDNKIEELEDKVSELSIQIAKFEETKDETAKEVVGFVKKIYEKIKNYWV